VKFNSVQVNSNPPQSYAFGVQANTFPGLWITGLHWEFGDGAFKDVPYCCQAQVSEVQNHAYSQPGSYTVVVVAYDDMGNFGSAFVTVNWTQPIPEYPSYLLPLTLAVIGALAVATKSKHKSVHLFH
jgi:PKD repeat protein